MKRLMMIVAALMIAEPAHAQKPLHHFVWFGGDREEIKTDTLFLNTKAIEGAQILYFWKRLEPAKDQYDFSAFKEDVAFLASHGKKLWIQLQDVTFSPQRYPVPQYLVEDSAYHGGAAKTWSVPGDDESKARQSGWVARRWDPAVQERFAKLLQKLGAEFDGRIEGINLPETAQEVGNSGKLYPPGFTIDTYRDAVATNMRALKLAFPKSVAMQYANFMPGEWRPSYNQHYLEGVYATAEKLGVAVGGPDLMPYNRGQLGSSYPLITQAAGKIPTGLAVQDGNLAQLNSATKEKVTAKELLDFASQNLRLDYIFWGREEPYYSKEVIPLLRQTAGAGNTPPTRN